MIEVIMQSFYSFVVMPYFFLASTSTFTQFLIRMLGQVIVLKAGLEASWQVSFFAAENSKT